MAVPAIKARRLNELLEGVRVDCNRLPARETLKHVLSDISVVLDDLWRKEQLSESVAPRVRVPRVEQRTTQCAVLTDDELARYLAWQHPDERHEVAVLERQTVSCIAGLFGSVRTGDLHTLRWESLDAAHGRFEWRYAPRSKTGNPQRLAIDEMLRPILHHWWQHQGCHFAGLVFPALRDGQHTVALARERSTTSATPKRSVATSSGHSGWRFGTSERGSGRPSGS
ncbi:hypothetical protein ACFL5O_07865 [Myxococcota bacterium]